MADAKAGIMGLSNHGRISDKAGDGVGKLGIGF
jgi:hypothetical protein